MLLNESNAGKRNRRQWTPARIKRVLEFKKDHTNRETMERFRVSSGQLHHWRTGKVYPRRSRGSAPPSTGESRRKPFADYLLAKRLKAQIREYLRQGGELNDLIVTAHELCKRILK